MDPKFGRHKIALGRQQGIDVSAFCLNQTHQNSQGRRSEWGKRRKCRNGTPFWPATCTVSRTGEPSRDGGGGVEVIEWGGAAAAHDPELLRSSTFRGELVILLERYLLRGRMAEGPDAKTAAGYPAPIPVV